MSDSVPPAVVPRYAPLKIPRETLDVVSRIAEILEPLTDEQRGFVIRTLVAIALPNSELHR